MATSKPSRGERSRIWPPTNRVLSTSSSVSGVTQAMRAPTPNCAEAVDGLATSAAVTRTAMTTPRMGGGKTVRIVSRLHAPTRRRLAAGEMQGLLYLIGRRGPGVQGSVGSVHHGPASQRLGRRSVAALSLEHEDPRVVAVEPLRERLVRAFV